MVNTHEALARTRPNHSSAVGESFLLRSAHSVGRFSSASSKLAVTAIQYAKSQQMTSATMYRIKQSDNSVSASNLEVAVPAGNTTPRTPSEESAYDSAASEYYLALSYNGYDCFRSVVEIALSVSFLAANSNLLRLLVSFKETETFIASETLVTVSIVLQILVAICIVTITVNDPSRYVKMKAFAVTGAILIALINVLIPFVVNVEHSRIDFGKIYRNFAGQNST